MSTPLVDGNGNLRPRTFEDIEKELQQKIEGVAAAGLPMETLLSIRVDTFLYLYRFFCAVKLLHVLAKSGQEAVVRAFPRGMLAPLMRTPAIRNAVDAVGDLRGDAPQPEVRTGLLTQLMASATPLPPVREDIRTQSQDYCLAEKGPHSWVGCEDGKEECKWCFLAKA